MSAFWSPIGVVASVVAGDGIDVDATDPANPIVSAEALTDADIKDVGHWEVVVSGTAPPVATTNEAEDDWVYGWVTG